MIKNIIFDLGGVLLEINYNHTIQAFRELGIQDFEQLFTQMKQTPIFDELEIGRISKEKFISELLKKVPNASTSKIENAWNAMLGEIKSEDWSLLQFIKNNYQICLLSNTNAIHLDYIYENVNEYKSLESDFIKTYYSHQINQRKPNPETFQWVLNQHNWNAHETLFIDDTIQHCLGAQKIGIQTIHLQVNKGENLSTYFENNGKLK